MDSTVFIKILLSDLSTLGSGGRFEIMKVEPNDVELFEGDEEYKILIKSYRVSSKRLRDYKYDKRHKKNK